MKRTEDLMHPVRWTGETSETDAEDLEDTHL